MSVQISIIAVDGAVKGSIAVEAGDLLSIRADTQVRLGHVAPGANALANALGCDLALTVAASGAEQAPAIAEPVPQEMSPEAELPPVGLAPSE